MLQELLQLEQRCVAQDLPWVLSVVRASCTTSRASFTGAASQLTRAVGIEQYLETTIEVITILQGL